MQGRCNEPPGRYTSFPHTKRSELMITNRESGTNVHEIADGIYRINTPVTIPGGPGQFSFNRT